jgi:hypothetical protein
LKLLEHFILREFDLVHLLGVEESFLGVDGLGPGAVGIEVIARNLGVDVACAQLAGTSCGKIFLGWHGERVVLTVEV